MSHPLFENATFDTATRQTMSMAFDAAWARVAPGYMHMRPAQIDAARAALASAMLRGRRMGVADPPRLKSMAERIIARPVQ